MHACLETQLFRGSGPHITGEEPGQYNRQFSTLPRPAPAETNRRVRVCIASPEISGPMYNGGIGTAYTAMAEALVRAGNEVTILYPHGNYSETKSISDWIQYYHERNIHFVPLPESMESLHPAIKKKTHLMESYGVFLWLKEHETSFDLVHFAEYRGIGFYSLLAKHQGLAFERTNLVVGVCSPTCWRIEANREYINSEYVLEIDFMERESVRLADTLFSSSQYMLQWLNKNKWKLPQQCYVQPKVLPEEPPIIDYSRLQAMTINEFVFFGRLERRKGLTLFCDAVDKARWHERADLSITFLGRDAFHPPAHDYIHSRAKRWRCRTNIISDKNRHEAVHYLLEPGRAAIIPSLVENSPNTVLECLSRKIPFIASDVGGIPELIAEDDCARICFKPDAAVLAKKLDLILSEGLRPSKPWINFADNETAWMQWHQTQLKNPTPQQADHLMPEKQVLVSVCMTHFNRPQHLARAIESIRRQNYSNFEVILVDDGSTQDDAVHYLQQIEPEFLQRNWKLLRQENKSPGAARNRAARHARGEYLLFMDDDNVAEPYEISSFVAVALRTGADILTCAMNTFNESDGNISDTTAEGIWLFLGAAAAVGALINPFGDTNALVRKGAFEKLGCFREEQIGAEDREFFARAILRGYHLQSIPIPLYRYRISPLSRKYTLDPAPKQWRVIQTYQGESPVEFQNLMSLLGNMVEQIGVSNSLDNPQKIVDRYWQSRSWRYTRPLRDLIKVLRGRPKERHPKVRTWEEAWKIISEIEDSVSWNLTGSFRLITKAEMRIRHTLRNGNDH
jgi:O-antigen biosynthesis protein